MGETSDIFTEICAIFESKGYNFVKSIGRGATAQCYLVFSRQYKQLFVAKVMVGVSEAVSECETAALRDLSHPNVLYLYDIHVTQQAVYLFLEYCPGGSLTDVVVKQGVLAGKRLYGVAKEILTGLSYMHGQKWAHLDLKPANILIDKHGRAKLADFGISRSFQGTEGAIRRGGTLMFAAPELLRAGRYDPFKADIWSLSVTLFFLAFGSFPFSCPVPGQPLPSYEFAEISFPPDADPLVVEALRLMMVIDPVARPTAGECFSIPLFAIGDVRDGFAADQGGGAAAPAGPMALAGRRSLSRTGLLVSKPLQSSTLPALMPDRRPHKVELPGSVVGASAKRSTLPTIY
jgi:serine/threonine protein kinase